MNYTFFGDRVDGTYAAIDSTHAHLNPPAALVWAQGFESAPARVALHPPAHSGWRAATELAPESDGSWSAPNLEQLMDGPIELSAHAQLEWKIENSIFRLALHHLGVAAQAAAFAQMCKAVVLEEEGIFGSFPHYDTGSYTFLIDFLPWASGDGMEHRDSTVISGPSDLKNGASREIGAVSHEFFHSWNVRRIRPKTLEPFDFDRADMSGELWFAEGFTNYYGILTLERAGLSSPDDFARDMASAVDHVLNAPGRLVHSPVEMSRLAPFVDAARSIDPNNFVNTYISYYTYGQALALGIDLEIRQRFPGKSLDDWMRTMWREHPDIRQPYTLADLERALAGTVGDPAFAADLFARHISGKEPLDYARALAPAGFVLHKKNAGQVWLGPSRLNFQSDCAEIDTATLRDTPLYAAGLDKGDRIERWGGKTLKTSEELTRFLARYHPGDRLSLQVQTRAGKKTVELVFSEDPSLEIVPFEKTGKTLTPAITEFRKAWLGSKALHPLPAIPRMPS